MDSRQYQYRQEQKPTLAPSLQGGCLGCSGKPKLYSSAFRDDCHLVLSTYPDSQLQSHKLFSNTECFQNSLSFAHATSLSPKGLISYFPSPSTKILFLLKDLKYYLSMSPPHLSNKKQSLAYTRFHKYFLFLLILSYIYV